MFDSAYQKILRIRGRGRDSSNNNKETEDEHESVEEYICGEWVKKDEYLIENGAYLFRELVKSTHGKNNPFRIFSLKELQKATNNFSEDLTLNHSSNSSIYSRSYRGIIEDRHIAAKIPRILLNTLADEVVSLSLIKHRNVVKLLGCCLETEHIIVVHELPPNGTLEQNIFHEKLIPPPVEFSWTDRLRIATEIADALAYLHLELRMTHGCLWAAEAVLLDEFHSAKLGAFETSKIQSQAESSDVETNIRNKFRKRNDVYYFGYILLDLLSVQTGERSIFRKCKEKVKILKYVKLNVSEKEMPQIEAYIDLLLRCRSSDIDKRVEDGEVMEEVARELRRIRSIQSMINHQPTTEGNESENLSSGAN